MKDDLRQGADRVCEILRDAGHEAYLAGGCVRDQLLGRSPKDYDIVTDARPERVAELFRKTVLVGAAFGVVKVLMPGRRDYEVATYRTEGEYSDGRRPDEVVYSDDWKEDVARRDLTINALLQDPVTDAVMDVVGGQADLRAQRIRAVGEPSRRFEEDKLRMLRAVRFAARFGFRIEPETEAAIRSQSCTLDVVSKERVVAEVEGIYRSDPGLGFRLMAELGLLTPALPHLRGDRVAPMVQRAARLAEATEGLSDGDRSAVGWALTVDGLDRKAAEGALRALKLSREAIRGALRLYDAQPTLTSADDPRSAAVMRLAAAEDRAVLRAYQRARLGPSAEQVGRFGAAIADVDARPLPARPIVSGEDLKALGLRPGRQFKDLMNAVDDAVLERRVTGRQQALDLVRTLTEE